MRTCGFNFNNTYHQLPHLLYDKNQPESCSKPQIAIVNYDLANLIELDLKNKSNEDLAQIFSGNILQSNQAASFAYAGHQFGHFTLLGDGRAHLLGEHVTSSHERFDVQLKGSGRTIYSRGGDGKAAIGPMLREYIISEAMYHLNIPTTRSLAVVTTGDQIMRESNYPGAILTRIAKSHIRVGTFEYLAYKQNTSVLKQLLDYSVHRHFSEVLECKNVALSFLNAVKNKQIDLIVNWMRVGFIHGVMNTDNMIICGETIDYGPCAFMDHYHPNTVFSSIDHSGRYAYSNQPMIAQWNLTRLAETLLPLIDNDLNKAIKMAKNSLKDFQDTYQSRWLEMMKSKLGFFESYHEDKAIILELLDWMKTNRVDFTKTFRDISYENMPIAKIYQTESFIKWKNKWNERLQKNNRPIQDSYKIMQENNPSVIPRNHQVEKALNAANQGDYAPCHHLLKALSTPYKENTYTKIYQLPPKPDERIYQTFCGT